MAETEEPVSPSIHGETIVETLLNTLEAERYVRGPLLATVVDELSAADGLEKAAAVARSILDELASGQLSEVDFTIQVRALRQLVRTLAASPSSGEVGSRAHGDLARAAPRLDAPNTAISAAS